MDDKNSNDSNDSNLQQCTVQQTNLLKYISYSNHCMEKTQKK
tara:strand:+ start:307 stop:432 length:126 start_codon:yes stop_codon:yes gene_type:complete